MLNRSELLNGQTDVEYFHSVKFRLEPDLLVAVHGITWLVEIKAGKGKENALQTAWGASWQGSRALVRDTEDVELLVKRMLTSRF